MADVANINDLLAGHVTLEVECLDRIYLSQRVRAEVADRLQDVGPPPRRPHRRHLVDDLGDGQPGDRAPVVGRSFDSVAKLVDGENVDRCSARKPTTASGSTVAVRAEVEVVMDTMTLPDVDDTLLLVIVTLRSHESSCSEVRVTFRCWATS